MHTLGALLYKSYNDQESQELQAQDCCVGNTPPKTPVSSELQAVLKAAAFSNLLSSLVCIFKGDAFTLSLLIRSDYCKKNSFPLLRQDF